MDLLFGALALGGALVTGAGLMLLTMMGMGVWREWWSSWLLTHKRVIANHVDGSDPYLTRYYLIGAPRMPDGSCPFMADGRVREGATYSCPWGLYVHCFHRSDMAGDLHSHPWKWALSFILKGGYSEERRVLQGDWTTPDGTRFNVVRRLVRPLTFNMLRSDTFHRVDLLPRCLFCGGLGLDPCIVDHKPNIRPCWSLFLTGPKFTSWGFWNRETNTFTPWREYLKVDEKLPEDY